MSHSDVAFQAELLSSYHLHDLREGSTREWGSSESEERSRWRMIAFGCVAGLPHLVMVAVDLHKIIPCAVL